MVELLLVVNGWPTLAIGACTPAALICPGSGVGAAPAAGGTAGCVNGAVAGTGGWLLSAPGTPCAVGLVLALSFVCWLRMLISGGVVFGRVMHEQDGTPSPRVDRASPGKAAIPVARSTQPRVPWRLRAGVGNAPEGTPVPRKPPRVGHSAADRVALRKRQRILRDGLDAVMIRAYGCD